MISYRPEIDGLRAIAVASVILFHAGFKKFSGGYVGVDIFFVISGYLITTIILTERERGNFSLVKFYERRIRRILPALFLVIVASLPFAYLWLLPEDLEDFSRSLVAISTFTSNIHFWHETGYWGAANELKPMLHTWSLAVEEQYYVVFPLLLMLMWRFPRRVLLAVLVGIATASFIFSQWSASHNPVANFFMLQTRAWELAIGACIAFYFLYRKQAAHDHALRRASTETLGVVGLLMIFCAVFWFDETLPFPGVYALLPTVGTGLVILCASEQTLVGRLLGTRLLVGAGLISYSAYLWHQPLFAFARNRSLADPSDMTFSVLVLLSFALGFLSWKYVETPFRSKERFSGRTMFAFAGIGLGAAVAIGIAGQISYGFIQRVSKSGLTVLEVKEKLQHNHGLSSTCENSFTLSPDCRTSDEPEILVWGDSYAMHLVQGIIASRPDARIIQMTKSLCGPFFDMALISEPQYPESWGMGCLAFTEQVHNWLKQNNTVKYAVISSNFENYFSSKNELLFRDRGVFESDIDVVAEEFTKTLEELESMGITPVIFSPLPTNQIDLGRCLGRADWLGVSLEHCSFHVSEITQSRLAAYGLLDRVQNDFRVVRLDKLLCNDALCKANLGSTFIYRDAGHFSGEGSAAIGRSSNFYEAIVGGASTRRVAELSQGREG